MSNVTDLNKPFKPRQVKTLDTVGQLATQFLAHKTLRGAAVNTVTSYQTDLEQFVGWLADNKVHYVPLIRAEEIDRFIDYQLKIARVTNRTAARKLATIKSFLAFCVRKHHIKNNPAEDAEPVRFVAGRTLSPELDQLIDVIESIPTTGWLGVRDRAFFYLMLHTASRVSGLCGLDVYAPSTTLNTITPAGRMFYTLKGGRIEEKALNALTLQYLADWLALRDELANEGEAALFVSRIGRRVTRQTMRLRLVGYGRAKGLHITPHMLRHARAKQVIDKLGMRAASDLLDHTQVMTTANIYGLESKQKNRALIDRECPLPVRRA